MGSRPLCLPLVSGIARAGFPSTESPPLDPILKRLSPRRLRRRESKRHLFVVDSLDKQMQNEKELIRLASAGVGGLFCICVESINLT